MYSSKNLAGLFFVVLCLIPEFAFAQSNGGYWRIIGRLEASVGLSQEQVSALEEEFEQAFEVCSDYNTIEEHRSCMDAQRTQILDKLETTLTSEQLEKYNTIKDTLCSGEQFGRKKTSSGVGVRAGRKIF